MSAKLNVSLSPDLLKWVHEQARRKGFSTAGEYVQDMLRRAQERQIRCRLDMMLVEAVGSKADHPMDDLDWQAIRKTEQGRAPLRRRKK